jgi:tetratricopeptide (TPR) repeat protein
MMADVYGRLALARGEPEAALRRISHFLETHTLPDEQRLLLHFTLGALCDKSGRYDEAFSHYRRANEIKGIRFDSTAFRNRIDAIIGNFSKERLSRAARSDCASDRPIFIVGMMRSGTSLVEQIVSSHSAVFGAGELPHLECIVAGAGAAGRDTARITAKQLNGDAGSYLDEINKLDGDARHVTDKLPQNFLYLGDIELMFPNARVIHCRRDPLDTCLSCYFQNFTAVQAHAFDLEALGHYYAQYRRLMEHWQQVLTIPVHEVNYEQLVSNPESVIGDILAFCGLTPEPRCYGFHENRRTVRTASYHQVRRPLYTSSVNRWHHYEKHLEPLVNILGR